MTGNKEESFYSPSWFDLIRNWVKKLQIKTWIFYLGLGITLILIQLIVLWLEAGLQAGDLLPVVIFNALAIPFLLALLQVLDDQAVVALNAMKPALDTTEQEFNQYEYRLSNMPFLAPLIAGLLVMLGTILTTLVSTEPVRYGALEQLPVFTIVFQVIDKSSAFLFGAVLYHTIRQLRLVNAINSKHVRVNLFQVRPLQAFSRLTVSTALGLLFFVYLWMLINPDLLSDPTILVYITSLTILAVTVFVWPLWGIHKLMQQEKDKVLHEINIRFEAAFSKFNKLMQDQNYKAAEGLNVTISSLEIQHNRISAIPTWPWSSETARLGLTAIALPLILMIIQFFVFQALDN